MSYLAKRDVYTLCLMRILGPASRSLILQLLCTNLQKYIYKNTRYYFCKNIRKKVVNFQLFPLWERCWGAVEPSNDYSAHRVLQLRVRCTAQSAVHSRRLLQPGTTGTHRVLQLRVRCIAQSAVQVHKV